MSLDDEETSADPIIETDESENCTFQSLGVEAPLCLAIKELGWSKPTDIQKSAIPEALNGRDIIGLAETGSGKTGAFAIPILQALLNSPQRLFAVILAPTRELAFQIYHDHSKPLELRSSECLLVYSILTP